MKKRNEINVWKESPSEDNANAYFAETIKLYQNGDYETALKGFEKLSEFIDTDLKTVIIPHIEKCKSIIKKKISNTDKHHMKNQAILKRFGWVNKLKYITGTASFLFFTLLTGDPEEGITFSDNLSNHPSFLGWVIVLAVLTLLLHKFMKNFTASEGLIRCKYCGKFTRYINPNEPTYGFMNNNNCEKCGRMYPVPDFHWDSWEGLDYMEDRHSVPDKKFYSEYNELKKKFAKEYSIFKKMRENTEKSE